MERISYRDIELPEVSIVIFPYSVKNGGSVANWVDDFARDKENSILGFSRIISIRGLRYPNEDTKGVDAWLQYNCPYRFHKRWLKHLPPLYTPVLPNKIAQAAERWPALDGVAGFLREDLGEVVLRQDWSFESLVNDHCLRALYSRRDWEGNISDYEPEGPIQVSGWRYWIKGLPKSLLKCAISVKNSAFAPSNPRQLLQKRCEPLTFIEDLYGHIQVSADARL